MGVAIVQSIAIARSTQRTECGAAVTRQRNQQNVVMSALLSTCTINPTSVRHLVRDSIRFVLPLVGAADLPARS